MITSNRLNMLAYALLFLVHVALIWILPFFPSQDGPSHIWNVLILHDLLHGGKEWGNYFTYSLHPTPNWGFNFIAYPLISLFSPLVAERIFLTIYVLLLGASAIILLKTFDRPVFPFSYLVFPVIFNNCLLMGFYSYVIAVPLFILSYSLAWKIRNNSIFCKFVCFNLSGIIIFYFHLIPSLFFILSLIAINIAEGTDFRDTTRKLLIQFALVSPFLLNIFVYMANGSKKGAPDFSYLLSLERLISLFNDLFFFSTVNLSPWQLVPGSIFISLVIFGLYSSAKEMWKANGIDHNTKVQAKLHMVMATIFTLVYLLAPFRLGDGAYFNQRFPWVILLILLPVFRLPQVAFFQHASSAVIAGTVTLFFAFNAVILWQESSKVRNFLGGMCVNIPKGSFIMAYKTKFPSWSRIDTLLHAASYYSIYKGCLDVGNYEASYSYFPTRFHKNLPPIPPQDQVFYNPESIDWKNYPAVHYLIGWDTDSKDAARLSSSFHVVWEGKPLTVWQRN